MRIQLTLAANLAAIGLLSSLPVKPSLAQIPLPPPRFPSPTTPQVAPASNERVFTAPNPILPPNEPVFTAPRGSVNGRFRVIIDSASPFVLQQARTIQPDAFFQNYDGRRVIQAGLFNDEFKARQQVSRFASQSIAARITTGSPQSNFEPFDTRRGYYAVIPGNQLEVQDYRDTAIRLGVTRSLVQVRSRPRGLHLSVGPFPSQREAEQVVRYLRDRGRLDARLFYDR
jgi:hypothetical protein